MKKRLTQRREGAENAEFLRVRKKRLSQRHQVTKHTKKGKEVFIIQPLNFSPCPLRLCAFVRGLIQENAWI